MTFLTEVGRKIKLMEGVLQLFSFAAAVVHRYLQQLSPPQDLALCKHRKTEYAIAQQNLEKSCV